MQTDIFDTKHNQPEYSVSQLSTSLKHTVEQAYSHVRVRGEISGCKRHSSGHWYLDLKDDKSVLNAVCWRGVADKLPHKPENGMDVICTGRITTYPGRSNYQLVIERLEPAGVGALMAMLEQRRKTLQAEGLFDDARKKPLPFLPERIGVITSPTGAVIRDILHRVKDRFPRHVIIWPVRVQGETAAAEVCTALAGMLQLSPRPDVIIIARGGGSFEDLWPFNDEALVRAVAASDIPIISAIGHETDTTLIDYAADKRAPTPTAAAEMAVPVRVELWHYLQEAKRRMQQANMQRITHHHTQLQGLARGLPKPEQLLEQASQRVDGWTERLEAALPARIAQHQKWLTQYNARLQPHTLRQRIHNQQQTLTSWAERLTRAYTARISQAEQRVQATTNMLHALSYHTTLERGFALVRDAHTNAPITRQKTAATSRHIRIEFADGVAEYTQ